MSKKLNGLALYFLLAEEKVKEHGLWEKGWRVEWFPRDSTTKCGKCSYTNKRIYLNHDYFHLTNDHKVLVNTILHEIAHALVWVETGTTGHTPEWRRRAISIGCDGERLNNFAVMPTKRTKGLSYAVPSFDVT